MKNLILIFSLFMLFACSKEHNEPIPQNPELLLNGNFNNPWEVNLDFVSDCSCLPLNARAWVIDPLNGIVNPALVFLTTYRDSIHGPIMHQKYYTKEILNAGSAYKFSCIVYPESVNNFKIYNLDGELIKEMEPSLNIQTVTFIASGDRIRLEGISAVGKMSIKKIICNN